jgi:phosphorylcholine metabolism protein LicD
MEKYINKIRYKQQYKILNECINILNNENIFYVPVGGTILGLHRDNCIIPYDDDFDFLIKKENKKKVINLMEENNYNIYYYPWG